MHKNWYLFAQNYIYAPYNSTLPDKWEHHPDTLEISKIQEQHKELNPEEIDQSEFTSSAGEDSDADIESNEVERDTDTRRRRRRKAKEDGETERLVATSNKFALLTAEWWCKGGFPYPWYLRRTWLKSMVPEQTGIFLYWDFFMRRLGARFTLYRYTLYGWFHQGSPPNPIWEEHGLWAWFLSKLVSFCIEILTWEGLVPDL